MKSKFIFPAVILSIVLAGCASQKVSIIESYQYVEATGHTNYTVLPLGSVSIPGKWNKKEYNSVSHQQFFKNSDSIELAIAFNQCNKYPFNVNGGKKGMAFVEAFYEWETQYFIDSYDVDRRVVEKDSENKYMIFNIEGKINQESVDTYFLFGEQNGNAFNASISNTDKWDEAQKIMFLKKLFIQE